MTDGGRIELYRNKARYITISDIEIPELSLNGASSLPNIDKFLDELRAEIAQEKVARKAQALMPRQGDWNYGAMYPKTFALVRDGVPEGSRSNKFHNVICCLKELDWSINGIVWLLERHPQG
jgi:hypothetical protein